MKRKVIKIDETKCTGCGLCLPNCPEGAIQIIDRKARLISDLFCDGLGACLGHCPENAITIEEREAQTYDESAVMANIARQGPGVIKAHLNHLKEHGETGYLSEALKYCDENGIDTGFASDASPAVHHGNGCPGAQSMQFGAAQREPVATESHQSSLTHWPVQLHLLSPSAAQYRGSDLLLAADCTAYALGDFHSKYLNGKTLAIACPKLDEGQEEYVDKLKALIDEAKINTMTVLIMQVPCCSGLLKMAQLAVNQAERKVPIKCIVAGIKGGILKEEWI
jgi:ferredoxin